MQIVSRLSRFDYSENQRSQRIALSAINNTFGMHSDQVQDTAMSQACSIGIDSCIFNCYNATQPSRLWVLRSLGPWSSGPESSVYSLPSKTRPLTNRHLLLHYIWPHKINPSQLHMLIGSDQCKLSIQHGTTVFYPVFSPSFGITKDAQCLFFLVQLHVPVWAPFFFLHLGCPDINDKMLGTRL